ncbi:zinc finger BED domain-containing protein 5-like [Macrobrachium rosenbergii]|uniref:zinc finger BED domain-containing protein 5-like n=1 Tax=Macrobrachium rosenbergii TaxID=79674 RepID=UPI0034D6AB5A
MARELETVPLSNDTITRRINDISNDIKCQLIERVKERSPNTNILILSDKIDAFTRKLERWAVRVDGGSVEMFPEVEEFMAENELSVDNVKVMITTHLQGLVDHFKKYFPKETTPQQYDWIRQPFTATGEHLSSDMEDELLELSSDRTLQASFGSTTLDEFWISIARNIHDYPWQQWMYYFL